MCSIARGNFIPFTTEVKKKASHFNSKKERKIVIHNSAVVGMPVFQLIQLWYGMRDYILIG
jgi:hypothetical protein